MPNATAGAHEAPSSVSTIDLGDAEDEAGDQRAGHAAQAASTTTQNVRPM